MIISKLSVSLFFPQNVSVIGNVKEGSRGLYKDYFQHIPCTHVVTKSSYCFTHTLVERFLLKRLIFNW